MPNLKLSLPPKEFIVNTDSITLAKIDEISEALGEVSKANSIFGKYPMFEEESLEEWQTRVMPILGEETKKKDGETNEEYLLRVHTVKPEKGKLLFDTLQALSKVFGQKESVTKETVEKGSYSQMKRFVRDILKECDFETKDFE
jgi:hypothetical protein